MERHASVDELLAKVPLFWGLSKKDLRRISGLATRLEEPADTVLAREGDHGYEFIIIVEGRVEVRRGDEVIATCGPSDYVGEIALLDNRPRTATLVTKTPAVLEVLDRREFRSLLAEQPELTDAIMTRMARRLAELEGHDLGSAQDSAPPSEQDD